MTRKYDIHNEYGVKVGELRESYGEEWAILGLMLIGAGVFLALPWTAYKVGKGTWSRHGCLTRAVTGLFTFFWIAAIVVGLFPDVFSVRNFSGPDRMGGLAVFTAVLIVPWFIGRASRE